MNPHLTYNHIKNIQYIKEIRNIKIRIENDGS